MMGFRVPKDFLNSIQWKKQDKIREKDDDILLAAPTDHVKLNAN